MILSDVTLILLYLGILQPGLQLSTYFSFVSLFNMCLFFLDGPRILLQEKKEIWIGLQGEHGCQGGPHL